MLNQDTIFSYFKKMKSFCMFFFVSIVKDIMKYMLRRKKIAFKKI